MRITEPESLARGCTAADPSERQSFRRVAGQTTVEFLLVCLPLLALIFLAVQLCLIWSAESMVQVAAYSAARKFAVCGNQTSALQAAMLYLPFAKSEDVTLSIGTSPGYGVLGGPTDPPGQLSLGQTFYVQLAVTYYVLPFPIVQQFFFDSFPQMTVEGPYQVGPQADAPNSQTLNVSPPDTVVVLNSTLANEGYTEWSVELYNLNYADPAVGKNWFNKNVVIYTGTMDQSQEPDFNEIADYCGCWQPGNTSFVSGGSGVGMRIGNMFGPHARFYNEIYSNASYLSKVPPTFYWNYDIDHWSVQSKMDGRITMYAGSVMTYESNGD